jgi:hypothetical protein
MSDLGLLGLILLGLWWFEGWTRVPRGAWVFRRGWSAWRAEGGWRLLGSGAWGWLWMPPGFLRPKLFLAQGLPMSLGRSGLWLHASQAPNPGPRPAGEGRHLSWSELASLKARGPRLEVGGQAQGVMQDVALPARLVGDLSTLSKHDPAKGLEGWIVQQLNPAQARRRLKRLRHFTRDLRLGLFVYAFWIFAMVPLIVWRRGWVDTWPWVLGGTLAYQGLLGWAAAWAHRRLLSAHREERTGWVIGCLLSPASLLRSVDHLSLRATADLHPVSLAAALMEGVVLKDLLERVGRDLNHPCEPLPFEEGEPALEVDREHRARLLSALQLMARKAGLPLDVEAVPAAMHSQGGEGWCPRCHAIYLRREGSCEDCGLALRSA